MHVEFGHSNHSIRCNMLRNVGHHQEYTVMQPYIFNYLYVAQHMEDMLRPDVQKWGPPHVLCVVDQCLSRATVRYGWEAQAKSELVSAQQLQLKGLR